MSHNAVINAGNPSLEVLDWVIWLICREIKLPRSRSILADGEEYPAYSQYLYTHPDHEAIAATLCTPGGCFVLNADDAP